MQSHWMSDTQDTASTIRMSGVGGCGNLAECLADKVSPGFGFNGHKRIQMRSLQISLQFSR